MIQNNAAKRDREKTDPDHNSLSSSPNGNALTLHRFSLFGVGPRGMWRIWVALGMDFFLNPLWMPLGGPHRWCGAGGTTRSAVRWLNVTTTTLDLSPAMSIIGPTGLWECERRLCLRKCLCTLICPAQMTELAAMAKIGQNDMTIAETILFEIQ